MTSERIQRRVDRLLDQAELAADGRRWPDVQALASEALSLDDANADALALLRSAQRMIAGLADDTQETPVAAVSVTPQPAASPVPTSFASGRYAVRRFLGEGGKKRVYLAHDSLLDRDVAFALIKTEGLDDAGRQRIQREAQAMGRLGSHPHIVSVFDLGTEGEQPFIVTELMGGGDVEGLVEDAEGHKLSIERALQIAAETCDGLAFAHEKNIVHRDLKPGNVWLTAAGVAKIGDFGLAVAVDRSRLTQVGMMVGTVSYMPPEQAMGGEVTPRSDLYSLGCMLYEMVCGRPPFVGDESVAIIGQHLNTPPVAPTWHRPDCPPGLEALILRLLEKDAAKRPASAAEVLQALQAVASAPKTATIEAPSVSPQGNDPLYRRTFVGRESELKQLEAAFDNALSGNGSIAMVVGEPGIGKTSLCEQLATYVAMRGGKALWGHCYEEGSLSLPYLAFVEAMRSYVLSREPDGLRSDLGTGAADVARIVSEIRDRMQVELRPSGDPDDDRWRLLQAVSSFLRNASSVQPLLIVLEDLHWADRGTLDLLLHVARSLQGSRLLIVGTYRDVEVDRAHPLSGALADLSRTATFSRMRLRGLTVDEVQRMMSNIRGQQVAHSNAELYFRQTEGNPLFIQEVLRYVVEEGLVAREGSRYAPVDQGAYEAGIPDGLRNVIGKRLSRLSPETNHILAVAAVIGRDFALQTLQAVAGTGEDELISALEEATRIGVLEERSRLGSVHYRFAHAFFRQTLYEEMSAPRRLRLHQQVALALEKQYAGRSSDHAAELAEHFSNSTESNDLAKAVSYGETAATRAMSVFDHGEAVRLLDRVLDVQEVLEPDDKAKRCDLLLALAQALLPAGEPLRVSQQVAEEAFALAESLPDAGRAWLACRLANLAWLSYGGDTMGGTSLAIRWAERADRYAVPGTVERTWADWALACVRHGQNRYAESWALRVGSLTLARRMNEPEALFRAVSWIQGQPNIVPPQHWRWFLDLADELAAASTDGVSVRTLGTAFCFTGNTILAAGDRVRAEDLWRQVAQLAATSRNAFVLMLPFQREAILAALDGRLEAAVDAGVRFVVEAEQFGSRVWGLSTSGFLTFEPLCHLGRYPEAMASLGQARAAVGLEGLSLFETLRMALCLAESGRHAEAQRIFSQSLLDLDIGSEAVGAPATILVLLLRSAVLLAERETVALLLERVKDLGFLAGMFPVVNTCIGRHLGAASALLGRPEEARTYYLQALEVCEKVRFRPEIALIRLGLSELLLEYYPDEHSLAIEHLDFAIAEFRDMKMQPSLERALRHRGLLKA